LELSQNPFIFSEEINNSKNNGTSEFPQIASTKDLFYVFWKDGARSFMVYIALLT
jgi:hypothetical protein